MSEVWDLAELAATPDLEQELDRLARSHDIIRTRQLNQQETWTVLGAALTRQLLSDPRLSNDVHTHAPHGALVPGMSVMLLEQDDPDHSRYRRLVTAAFASRAVRELEPRIVATTRRLLDDLGDSGTADFVGAFTYPMPLEVICDLLGVPDEEREPFRKWAMDISAAPSAEAMQTAAAELFAYCVRLIGAKRRQPTEDLLSELIAARFEDGTALTDEELSSFAAVLLIAGHDTVTNLLANALYDLLTHPEQLAALRRDASLVGDAVEEALRFRGSAMTTVNRVALEDIEAGGVTIRKGELVRFLLNAANRDEELRADPHTFDIRRATMQHVAFGMGPHFCLGQRLARQEATIALTEILDRFPTLELAVPEDKVRWLASDAIRGLEELPLRYAR
ncbi:cytochrome P450 family protein [Streptomyces swartbergensis]|uniref:Cytochrome P450 n=1 Tax=Streptomyces swartbergensis TaxID=487165 RepID=A0A243SB36_9ACTN|nr:cytochrome P450 [Streptomyces swartbergensis]OUD04881.1 cytochrome P450 [Streptomyces swartbergensis]